MVTQTEKRSLTGTLKLVEVDVAWEAELEISLLVWWAIQLLPGI